MEQEVYNSLLHAASSLGLAMPRAMVALLFVPAMALKELRGLLKTAVVVATAMPVAVSNYYSIDYESFHSLSLAFTLLKEAAIGMLIGVLLSLPFNIFISVGAIIDNQRGATSGQMADPALGQTTFLGSFMQRTFVIVMIEAGMFGLLFSIIIDSYALWPVAANFPEMLFSGEQLVISQFSDMTQKIMLYVLPVLIVMLMIDLGFAILGLFSPQMQVYFLSMPAKSIVALLVLALYATSMWYYGVLELERFNDLKANLPLLLSPITTQ